MPGSIVTESALMATRNMPKMCLDDTSILGVLTKSAPFGFISNKTWRQIDNGALRLAFDDPTTVQTMAIWKNLVIDAIHFLRINDARERAFVINNSNSNHKYAISNKTTMATKHAETSATLNTYGIEELQAYFNEFRNFESTLYGTDHYYRDHTG